MGMFDPNCANLPPAQGGIYNVPTYNSEVGRKGGGALSASSSSSFPVISDAEQATLIEVAQTTSHSGGGSSGKLGAHTSSGGTPCYSHVTAMLLPRQGAGLVSLLPPCKRSWPPWLLGTSSMWCVP